MGIARAASGAGEPFDHGRELVDLPSHERRDPESLAKHPELVDEAVDRVDEEVRRLDRLALGELDARSLTRPLDHGSDLRTHVVRDGHGGHRRIDVEVEGLEPVACAGAHPTNLLLGRRERDAAWVPALAAEDPRREPDDVRLAPSQLERSAPAATDQERRGRAPGRAWAA